MYELNVMELYTEHRLTSYEGWCLLLGRAEVHVTLMRRDYPACRVWVSLYLLGFEPILPIWGSSMIRLSIHASMFGSLWPVIPLLFGVGQTLDFMILNCKKREKASRKLRTSLRSMLVKFGVPQCMKDNEMNINVKGWVIMKTNMLKLLNEVTIW